MRLTHEKMHALTANMPMKLIRINDNPYLERYYAGTFADGWDLWLHHFIRNDEERHLHSHPFVFCTIMLVGGYTEHLGDQDYRITLPAADRALDMTLQKHLHRMQCEIKECHKEHGSMLDDAGGEYMRVGHTDWHRISAVNPDTWTAVLVHPDRRDSWEFRGDDGTIEKRTPSPRDWWKDYAIRPADGFVVGDNRKHPMRTGDIVIPGDILPVLVDN